MQARFRRTSDGVLTHKHTNRRHIGRRGSNTPASSVPTCSVVEGRENELCRLVGWSFGQDSNAEAADTHGMQDDRGVVQVSESADAERVDHAVRKQHGGIYAQGLSSGGFVACAYGGSG